MDLHVLTSSVGVEETLLDAAAENPFDLDIHLPEYYPDVQRIFKCTVQPNLSAVSAGTDRITAEGNGVLRLLYAAEDGRAVVYEQSFPFSRSVPMHSDDADVAISASAKTDFVNCRATGQRRVSVHGVICVRFSVKALRQQKLIVGAQEDVMQVRTQCVQAFSQTALTERTFAMSEVVEIGAENASIGQIVRADCTVRTDSVKAVKDKLLVKGELATEVLYAAENGGEWVRFRHAMPISQIVESIGVAEENLHDVTMRSVSLDVVPKADGGGEQRLLEIAARISVSVRSGVMTQTHAVWDAYSTKDTLQSQYGDVTLRSATESFQETMTVKQTVVPAGTEPAQLVDVRFDPVQRTFRLEGDNAVVDCAVTLGFVYRDAQGSAGYAEKQIEFSYRKILSDAPQAAECDPIVQITGCKGVLGADGSVEVKLEALVCGTVYALQTQRLLLSASLTEPASAPERAAMTIYFSDAGESVWEIARRYGTTVCAVQEENGLADDTVPEKRMLVIPTV